MRANYGRPSGNKGPGHDSAEVEQVIIEAEQAAAATDAKTCPFCGAAPEVYIKWMYRVSAGVGIHCSRCRIGTGLFPVGKMITGSEYTVADRITQAAAIWNRREV